MSGFPIWIPGVPIPQGSKAVSRSGHAYESNRKLRPWRAVCESHLRAWRTVYGGGTYDGPLGIEVTFYLPRPKRPRWELPAVKPDADKLARALGDALTASGVIRDDARVTTWRIRKRYGEPGVRIHSITADTDPPREDPDDGA